MSRELVLASTSRYRRELMDRLAIPYRAEAPEYDEPPLDLAPENLAATHADEKARSLGSRFPDALIIGSDQLVSLDGAILGKPGSRAGAIDQLTRMQGRMHRLITALSVYEPASAKMERALVVHEMTMRRLSREAIAAYVAYDNPIDCAGSYKLESRGIALFESIRGEDDTAIVGLPLLSLVKLLGLFGVDVLAG